MNKHQWKNLFGCFVCLFLVSQFGSCGSVSEDDTKIIEKIQNHRRYKDRSYKKSLLSPIPDEHKKEFQGLKYFPVNLSYRFNTKLHKYPHPRVIRMMTSLGVEREALKYGHFNFQMENMPCVLQVYKLLDVQESHPNYLFVPFLDVTTGEESYPGGRYLDFKETANNTYTIDFNMAFNPFCAYGKKGFNCPLPPKENRLDVPIKAGEKNYFFDDH